MNWPYLATEPFKLRYVVSAHLLQDCPEIIEIGGYKTPITGFLHSPKRITVLDPNVEPYQNEYVSHLAIWFQDWQAWPEDKYGVLILGLELHMGEEAWARLYQLIDGSQTTVIETAMDHIHSTNQFAQICSRVKKKVALTVLFDLSDNDFSSVGGTPKNSRRKLYVLQ